IQATIGNMYMKEPVSIGKNKKNILTATPAPLLMPMMPGSDKSFRLKLCSMTPDVARAMPHSITMNTRGNRISNKTNELVNAPCPNKVGTISLNGITKSPVINEIVATSKTSKQKSENNHFVRVICCSGIMLDDSFTNNH